MSHIVITTTIYQPDALHRWARALRADDGDAIIVSGDVKTPHSAVRTVLASIKNKTGVKGVYIPDHGDFLHTGEAVGWNSIQRRNIAILHAIQRQPDFITTVDTDNYPVRPDHLSRIRQLLTEPWMGRRTHAVNGFANPAEWLNPRVIHRGIPLSFRSHLNHMTVPSVKNDTLTVGVHSSLWWDDPDIDAIERLHNGPIISRHLNPEYLTIYGPEVWAPFNSQATTYVRDLFPLLCVWPGIGRMDDIWASYVAQHIMKRFSYVTAYGEPFVIQERHAHDAVNDLMNEMHGYRYTGEFVDYVQSIDIGGATDVYDALKIVVSHLLQRLDDRILPDETKTFLTAWLADVQTAMIRGTSA